MTIAAMKRLQDMGASYFILDLRDNLGGLVQAGIEIAKLFLNEGDTVIYTVGRDPQYQQTIVAETAPLTKAPLIILVNNNTASASEIVASALHDNCRAALVGERTFGKGLIQSVFELHDGSGVVVTVGKYVTPNHKDINGNGIEPDYRNFPGSNLATVPQTLFHPLLEQFPAQDLLLESYRIFPKASSHEFGGVIGSRCKGVWVLNELSTYTDLKLCFRT
ncbi:hypothetical protein TIFTF001_012565 [Ficus carica]|uniref:C-terminal processing peptidase n=1 Tax=Ficus carica TaxID=3494 RepID=A0AA87ZZ87_FICCA|nr:hypothetical protein TIFTF001_012565 [Ficus carica]